MYWSEGRGTDSVAEKFQDTGISSHSDNWIAMSIHSKVLTWFLINKISYVWKALYEPVLTGISSHTDNWIALSIIHSKVLTWFLINKISYVWKALYEPVLTKMTTYKCSKWISIFFLLLNRFTGYLMQHLKNPPLAAHLLANSSFSASLQSFAQMDAS